MMRTLSKIFLILSFCFITTSNATNFYVDKNATGNNSGTSWQNAWTSFSSINWVLLNPGDILYISGGSSSKTYTEELAPNRSGNSGNNIVITKGTSSGHNGTVIIDGGGSVSHNISLQSVSYVTVQYLTVRGATGSGNVDIDGCTGVVVDSLNIFADSGHSGISIKTSSGVHLQRNYITTPANTSDQTDGIYSQDNAGKNYYHDNYIVISNSNSSPHCDGIQSYRDKDLDIYNNYVEQDNTKSSNAQGIFGSCFNGTIRVWNNIVNQTRSNSNAISWRNEGCGSGTVIIYGNTIYGETGADHSIWVTGNISTAFVKNNVMRYVGVAGGGIVIPDVGYGNVAYNGQSNIGVVRGTNAITGDPLYTDPANGDFTLQSGSPCIDAGTVLGSPYDVDINGTQRPLGNGWDMGAYEIQTGPDITPPELQGAIINNSTQVTLFFSENLDPQSAQSETNYTIDNSINVITAVLSNNNRHVILTTTEHELNLIYTVIVNNVTDLSGNLISPENNSAQYELIINTAPVFPVDLFGTPEDEKTVTVSFSIPPDISEYLTYHMVAFDADHGGGDPPEGHAYINGHGPIELFPGATQQNGDGSTNIFEFTAPSSWWVDGDNELRFVRIYSTGYRIDTASVAYEVVPDVNDEDIPISFALLQNYPNPFNPTTNISFTLPVDSKVKIAVYNLLGEEVAELANSEFTSGNHTINFDATGYTSGIYFYTLQANDYIETKKMILMK